MATSDFAAGAGVLQVEKFPCMWHLFHNPVFSGGPSELDHYARYVEDQPMLLSRRHLM
jgi:hypothetical protein